MHNKGVGFVSKREPSYEIDLFVCFLLPVYFHFILPTRPETLSFLPPPTYQTSIRPPLSLTPREGGYRQKINDHHAVFGGSHRSCKQARQSQENTVTHRSIEEEKKTVSSFPFLSSSCLVVPCAWFTIRRQGSTPPCLPSSFFPLASPSPDRRRCRLRWRPRSPCRSST